MLDGCWNKLKSHHAGALGLNDDFGNAKCGPSFPQPDPASHPNLARTARGAREMSCSERPASTPVPVTVAHISRLKLHVRSRFASVAAHTAEAEKSVSAL